MIEVPRMQCGEGDLLLVDELVVGAEVVRVGRALGFAA